MKVTVTIAGLDAMKLGAPLRQLLLDALRTRVAATSQATPFGEPNMPNAPLESLPPASR